ncbi:MAG: hypothetical protein OXD49_21755 [Candidatus Poribacteria bacterium]|nr:hypothetical protein [Candidatus Poribacteria bacterium]
MSEATQSYLGLESSTIPTNLGFQSTLDYIRETARSERQKGDLFERLMLTYFTEDPDYQQQFSEVWLYKDWAARQTGYDANDIGIDLVAKEREGGTEYKRDSAFRILPPMWSRRDPDDERDFPDVSETPDDGLPDLL